MNLLLLAYVDGFAPTAGLTVSCPSNTGANGSYARSGSLNLKPKYVSGINAVVWTGTQWEIIQGYGIFDNLISASSQDVAYPWMATFLAPYAATITRVNAG